MRIKKYRARDMKEALVQVKEDFGTEAVILHSRNVLVGGFFGLFGKEMVEVTAGGEINILEDVVSRKKEFNPGSSNLAINNKNNFKFNLQSNISQKPLAPLPEDKIEVLGKQLSQLETQINNMARNMMVIVNNMKTMNVKNSNQNLHGIFEYLISLGISEKIATSIIEKAELEMTGKDLKDNQKVEEFLQNELLPRIKTCGPIELGKTGQKVIAFIGSTGVGKTTTIAKLAANFALMQKKKVALITIDTYRIAAIEQLKTYGNIIGVPIDVVFTPEEFKQTLSVHSDADLILIDTAGRSPKNTAQMKELKKFIETGGAKIECYLVLSVTSKPSDLDETINKFDIIKSDKVVFTKLDETSSFGVVINVLSDYAKQVSYITTGQNVPDDLEVAKDKELLQKIMSQVKLEL